jgi:VWFA-related protein
MWVLAWPQAQQPVFRTGVDLVQLDVSVLDKDRQPVRGLTAADFTVLEDGAPQTIAAFAAFDVPDVVDAVNTWQRRVAPDVTTNAPTTGRLLVMVLDDSTVEMSGQPIAAAPKIARRLVEHLDPTDRMAVVFTRDNRHAQGFTSDRARLLAAIDHYTLGFRGQGDSRSARLADSLYYQMSMNVLDEVADMLIAIPERRKALIYVGQGVPVDVAGAATPGVTPRPMAGNVAVHEGQVALATTLRQVFERAQRANVNVYTLDTCGLRMGTGSCKPGLEVEFLQVLADNTGGLATVNTNDFEPGITQIFRENGSYYLLGYQPTNTKADGTFRRVEVQVNRPGVEVRTRHMYAAPDAARIEKAAKAPPPSPAVAALANLLPKADLPLQVAVAPFAVPGKDTAAVTIALGVRQPLQTERLDEGIELLIGAFTPEGDARGSETKTITLSVPPPRRGSEFTRYEALSRIDLKPGRYELRLSAHSTTFDKRGSVYVDVDVPDFVKAPLSLSGVMLSATPGVPVAPADLLRGMAPVIPTSERTFSRVERVSAFLRVYQGGNAKLAPVTLAIRIVDPHDATAFERTDTLGVDSFAAARAADVTLPLPLIQLAPGEYLLTIEATLGKVTSRREVRFTVR